MFFVLFLFLFFCCILALKVNVAVYSITLFVNCVVPCSARTREGVQLAFEELVEKVGPVTFLVLSF